jgi:hypothetical protein
MMDDPCPPFTSPCYSRLLAQALNYSGSVKFKTASGKDEEHPFYLSAEQYRHTLAYDEEQLKTHHQLQQIPKELKTLRNEIKRFGKR